MFFRTQGQPLLGEKYVTRKKERKNERKIISKLVDIRFPLQRPRAAHLFHLDQYIKESASKSMGIKVRVK